MKTPEMLDYVRDIGALGGTLTLEYNSGELTLTGDELIQAAADYEMSEPFTIVPASTDPEPWELAEDDGWEPYRPGNLSKILTVCGVLTALALFGLAFI